MLNLPFLGKSQSDDKLWAALDISPTRVTAVAFSLAGGQMEVLGFGRSELDQVEMRGGVVADLAKVAQKARAALDQAVLGLESYPRQAVIGAGAEAIRSFSVRGRIARRESEQPITEEEWQRIEGRLREEALVKARRQLAREFSQEEVELAELRSHVTQILLDGYEITNSLGFRGKNLEVGWLQQLAIKSHLAALKSIASFLKFKKTLMTDTNFPLLLGGNRDQVLINDRGLTTEVTVRIRRDIIGTKVVPLGGAHLLEGDGDILRWWLSSLELALSSLGVEDLPSRFVLVSESANRDKLEEQLRISEATEVVEAPDSWGEELIDRSGRVGEAGAASLSLLRLAGER